MSIVEEPICPRYGYDLRGAVASWREACPLEGTCPECGLGYGWVDVLLKSRQLDRRFIEHARGAWGCAKASVRTLLWTLNPPRRVLAGVAIAYGHDTLLADHARPAG